MKSGFVTTLSMVGVLAAGGTAFAVNTSVLDQATRNSEASPALRADVVAIGITDQTPSTVASASDAPASTTLQSQFNIDGAGIVTLAQDAGVLTTVAVEPTNGFTYEIKNGSDSRVEVLLTKDTQQLVFQAELLDGRIVTSLTSPRAPQVSPGTIIVGTPAGDNVGDDDDVDDDDVNEGQDSPRSDGEEDDD